MYRRYYSYNDMPQLVKQPEKPVQIHKKEESICKPKCETHKDKLLGKFEIDAVILAVIILALLLDDGDDNLLLIALAFVFITGIV